MTNKKSSGKIKFITGISQFLWAELKTMNTAKLKSLYKIGTGYITMKFFTPKKVVHQKPVRNRELEEAAYRLSS